MLTFNGSLAVSVTVRHSSTGIFSKINVNNASLIFWNFWATATNAEQQTELYCSCEVWLWQDSSTLIICLSLCIDMIRGWLSAVAKGPSLSLIVSLFCVLLYYCLIGLILVWQLVLYWVMTKVFLKREEPITCQPKPWLLFEWINSVHSFIGFLRSVTWHCTMNVAQYGPKEQLSHGCSLVRSWPTSLDETCPWCLHSWGCRHCFSESCLVWFALQLAHPKDQTSLPWGALWGKSGQCLWVTRTVHIW